MTNDKATVRDVEERQHPAVQAFRPDSDQNKSREQETSRSEAKRTRELIVRPAMTNNKATVRDVEERQHPAVQAPVPPANENELTNDHEAFNNPQGSR